MTTRLDEIKACVTTLEREGLYYGDSVRDFRWLVAEVERLTNQSRVYEAAHNSLYKVRRMTDDKQSRDAPHDIPGCPTCGRPMSARPMSTRRDGSRERRSRDDD